MHLTQPAVSTQVKQLEEAAGIPLFEQMGKKIYLTEAGREMYEFSRGISQKFSDIEMLLGELKGIRRGTLHIAVTSTAKYFAPYLLAAFCKKYPGISINLEVTNRESILKMLNENAPDMALMGSAPEDADLDATSFMSNPLVAIAAPDHPLAGKSRITLEQLLQERFIMREPGSGTRSAIERFIEERGLKMGATMEMSRNEAIKHAVMAGLGLGILSIHTLEMELQLERLVILNVEGLPILKDWYLVHRPGKRLSPTAQGFKDFVLNEAGNVVKIPNIETLSRRKQPGSKPRAKKG
jgi:DNA-binding transcriptional LysR family regulator